MDRLPKIKLELDQYFETLERRYPNRNKVIHKQPCKGCPSTFGHDPETSDIKSSCSKEFIARELLFVCYKRTSKLCKGLCDLMEIDQEYLDSIYGNDAAL